MSIEAPRPDRPPLAQVRPRPAVRGKTPGLGLTLVSLPSPRPPRRGEPPRRPTTGRGGESDATTCSLDLFSQEDVVSREFYLKRCALRRTHTEYAMSSRTHLACLAVALWLPASPALAQG